jgi:hypothetical protein
MYASDTHVEWVVKQASGRGDPSVRSGLNGTLCDPNAWVHSENLVMLVNIYLYFANQLTKSVAPLM